jgi:ABC-type multidrug transport system, ATPase and permease components
MFEYIKRYWKDNVVLGFLLVGTAITETFTTILMSAIFNALIAFDLDGFMTAIFKMFVTFMIFLGFTYLKIVKQNQTIQKMVTAIRADITSRIEKTSYNGFHEKQVGTYASWLSNDMNTIETQAYSRFYDVAAGLIGTLTAIIALFFYHWSLVIWSLLAAGITLLLPRLLEKQMNEATLKTTQENERFLSKTNDVLSGFDTLFSFNQLKKITKDIKEASIQLAQAKDIQTRAIGKVAILGAFGNVFGQLSVLMLTGWLALQNILTVGSIASTTGLAGTIFNTVGNISQQIAGIRATQPIFDKFETIKTGENSEKEALSELDDGFEINNLSYAYGDKEILKNINYSFDLNNKYAVVGASGSGKSTLLNILNGKLTDYTGSVTLSNQELKDVKGKDLRDRILYIDQTPYLFEGTIRYNITLGEEFSDAQLGQAIKESNLEGLIESLPEGLDTSVGEAGRSFSGGQRQRIALARGLIRGKTYILVDEGTSSLDEASALKIEDSLMNNPELTVIMITHHLKEPIKERLDGILQLA